MKLTTKPLDQQVLLVTGASSGIGLTTAREAARRGARVVLVSRDAEDLTRAEAEIRAAGGQATHAVADVADYDALRAAADHAERTFGGIDTWVNNAGVSIYGRIAEVTLDDARRLFETNYWGLVHGSLIAVERLRARGGVLVNIGSVLSDTGYPLQGHYTASKHAVKGFTDSLRMELEKERVPVAVCLVKPAAIDTPYPEHAGNYLGVEPKHVPPVYAPEAVASAILSCAVKPQRDVKIGGSAKMFSTMETFVPRLGDRFKVAGAFDQQRTDRPALDDDTLYAPRTGDGRARGNYPGHVRGSSLYTRASLNPVGTVLGAAAVGLGIALLARGRVE